MAFFKIVLHLLLLGIIEILISLLASIVCCRNELE